MMRRSIRPVVAVAPLAAAAALACAPEEQTKVDEPTPLYTPAWAFEPWVSKDISDGADMRAFVDGFKERDIPVGVMVLDSPWETNYNTFIPNDARYPAFADMVRDYKDEGIRTVLWTTQMVNQSSFDLEAGGDRYDGAASNFIEGQDKKYFVNDGDVYLWWKGNGAAVDFFNDDARAWWHAQQDQILDMGVAGWKLDFGEQYIDETPIRTAQGEKTLQEYSEQYYRDFYEHGREKYGNDDFLTMVRPYDESYGFAPRFYSKPETAPVTWVGDQYRDTEGFIDSLDEEFRSAQAGYSVIGSDIGGYLDRKLNDAIPFDLAVFRHWTAVNALLGLFQLHGRANLAPWTVPVDDAALVDETTQQYRYWATLHHALVPYLYSVVREAQQGGAPAVTVVGDTPESWAGDYRFFSGPAFLAGALSVDDGAGDFSRNVLLPPLASTTDGYLDWYALGGDALAAGSTARFTADATHEVALYVREGSIIPLHVDSDALGLGDPSFKDALTVLAFPGAATTSFTLHDTSEAHADDTGTIRVDADGTTHIDGVAGRVIVRIRTTGATSSAVVDGAAVVSASSLAALAQGGAASFADAAGRAIWVAVTDGTRATIELR